MNRTVRNISIHRNYGERPTYIVMNRVWGVEPGEKYDLVQFSVDNIEKYYWRESLCFPAGTNEEKIKEEVEKYANNINDEDVASYKSFLDFGEKWGWD